MTAAEYLEYFSSLFDSKADNRDYVLYLLDRVGLSEKRNVPIGQFSRGMKQRLGIAKSLVNRPRIIFLDEPTLGLDPRGQFEIQQLLKEINRSDKITIFITSHQLKDIEVLCSKVGIVKNGRLVEQGSIPELQRKYMLARKSDFAAVAVSAISRAWRRRFSCSSCCCCASVISVFTSEMRLFALSRNENSSCFTRGPSSSLLWNTRETLSFFSSDASTCVRHILPQHLTQFVQPFVPLGLIRPDQRVHREHVHIIIAWSAGSEAARR